MRLPRRVPWASAAEFEHVASLFLTPDDTDGSARSEALDLIQVWASRGHVPHAVESTASLLKVILRDERLSNGGGGVASSAWQDDLRLAYSMALTRFVNGLVDAHQTAMFARSIATIASQIGLPASFVEVRHAATHEDLPSLETARMGAREALAWLHDRYWIPLSSSVIPDLDSQTRRDDLTADLRPLLKRYKALLKLATKDRSQAGRLKVDIHRVERDIERWVVGAGIGDFDVEAVAQAGRKRRRDDPDEREAEEEGQAGRGEQQAERGIELLVGELLQPGGLVPLSRKKRLRVASKAEPLLHLPPSIIAIWAPFLSSLGTCFPRTFVDELLSQLLDALLLPETSRTSREASGPEAIATIQESEVDDPSSKTLDSSYYITVAGWVTYVLETFAPEEEENVIKACLISPGDYAMIFLRHVFSRSPSPSFHEALAPLLKVADARRRMLFELAIVERNSSSTVSDSGSRSHRLQQQQQQELAKQAIEEATSEARAAREDAERIVLEMESKMAALRASLSAGSDKLPSTSLSTGGNSQHLPSDSTGRKAGEKAYSLSGWRLLTAKEWRPTPIGCLSGDVPNLELPPLPVST